MEAMKQASENERKEYFHMVYEQALIIQRNHLLELQIHHLDLMTYSEKINNSTDNVSESKKGDEYEEE